MDTLFFDNVIQQLHRRDFLIWLGKGAQYSALTVGLSGLSACGGGKKSSGSPPGDDVETPADTGIPKPTQAYTVLKRTSFGVQQAALADINRLGIDAFLEAQLSSSTIADNNLEAHIAALFPLTQATPATLLAGFPDNIADVASQMVAATQYRQMFSERQLYEVMVEFWSDHFNIHLLNGLEPTLKPADDLNVIRLHALGNFRDLLHASAKSAAMLFYLDNFNNVLTAPNENYARELMELHTLGVEGGYSETDIKEVARCFTGWSITFPGDPLGFGQFVFRPTWHDTNAKTVLGQTIAAGGGQTDGEQVLDILASHPSTAQFIAQKLCRRFIADAPAANDVSQVAQAFRASNGDIKSTLRRLFSLDSFRNQPDQKFTRPSEYLAQIVRALLPDRQFPSDNGRVFYFAQSLLGHLPFFWSTPDGYPDSESYWASTSGMMNRWRLSFLSFAGLIPDISMFTVNYVPLINGADTIAELVDALTDSILMRPLAADDRQQLITTLADNFNVSANQSLGNAALQGAPLVAAILISSAYFHLR